MVYIPNLDSNKCYEIIDNNIIREHSTINLNEYNQVSDIYINSNYLVNSYELYLEKEPICINQEQLTSDFYYRNDFPSILFIFLVLLFICLYLPYKVFTRFYKGKGWK